MTLERLLEALHGAQLKLHVNDILDALWLATRGRELSLEMPIPSTAPPEVRQSDVAAGDSVLVEKTAETGEQQSAVPPAETVPSRPESDETRPVYAAGHARSSNEARVKATAVAVPAARALHGRLALGRALRPFRQRWPLTQQLVLDEAGTVELSAELKEHIYPVFRPSAERWFDVEVVIEDDPAIDVWHDTLREFGQVLHETGAFRSVRLWRLRIPDRRSESHSDGSAFLENSLGRRLQARAMGDAGVRRLVLFATHGASDRWLDGSYAQILAPWIRGACVALLQLLDKRHWQHSALGEPEGLGLAEQPGARTANLQIQKFWWALQEDEDVVRLPAVALTPAGLNELAHMQMARGRRCPVYFIDAASQTPHELTARPVLDFERAVALLRESSQQAFLLAVYLCLGTFTLPVARLVQEAKFGGEADQSCLAAVLLSGLVFARSRHSPDAEPMEQFFEFHAEARDVLLRSFRADDAQFVLDTLEQHVSRHMEEIHGRAVQFRALVPDANGEFDLPAWAQPFARLGTTMLRLTTDTRTPEQLIEEFRSWSSSKLFANAALQARAATRGDRLHIEDLDAELRNALFAASLVERTPDKRWEFAGNILNPLAAIGETAPLRGVRVLWVDDHPQNNTGIATEIEAWGAQVRNVLNTDRALAEVQRETFDVIISDMTRGRNRRAGFELLHQLGGRHSRCPVIIFASSFAESPDRREAVLGEGGFACTNSPRALVELVFEAVSRPRASPRLRARYARVLARLQEMGIQRARGSRVLTDSPSQIADAVMSVSTTRGASIAQLLELVRVYADASLSRLLRIRDGELEDMIRTPTGTTQSSPMFNGDLVTAALRLGERKSFMWEPDVRATGRAALADTTRSMLLLPLLSSAGVVAGALHLEMPEPDALGRCDIEWLRQLFLPVADWEETTDAQATRDYALVIGADTHVAAALPSVHIGVGRFREWLESSSVPAENIEVLTGASATAAEVIQCLRRLASNSRFRRFYFYFAGHAIAGADLKLRLADDATRTRAMDVALSDYIEAIDRLPGLQERVTILDIAVPNLGASTNANTVLPRLRNAQIDFFYACGNSMPYGIPAESFTGFLLNALDAAPADADGALRSSSLARYVGKFFPTADVQWSGEIEFRPPRPRLAPTPLREAEVPEAVGRWPGPNITIEPSVHTPAPASVAKNIVLAFDGVREDPGALVRTNVQRFVNAVEPRTHEGTGARQVSLYVPGTSRTPGGGALRRITSLILGQGFSKLIRDAYAFLVDEYESGDDIFIVGFSRGAYIARCLAGMVSAVGVIRRDAKEHINDTYEYYMGRDASVSSTELNRFRNIDSRETPIRFLGLLETVDPARSVVVQDPWDRRVPPAVSNAFHALAVDETRPEFTPKIWSKRDLPTSRRMEQRWFCGSHDDLGGIYPDREVAEVPLRWLQDRAMECGLALDVSTLALPKGSEPGIVHPPGRGNAIREIGMVEQSNEVVDPSVFTRYRTEKSYRPASLVNYLARVSPGT